MAGEADGAGAADEPLSLVWLAALAACELCRDRGFASPVGDAARHIASISRMWSLPERRTVGGLNAFLAELAVDLPYFDADEHKDALDACIACREMGFAPTVRAWSDRAVERVRGLAWRAGDTGVAGWFAAEAERRRGARCATRRNGAAK